MTAALLGAGCSDPIAAVSGVDAAPGPEVGGKPTMVGGELPTEPQTARRIRRLNNVEMENVLSDVLGGRLDLTKGFLPDAREEGYDNDAVALGISDSKVDEVATAAERAAGFITAPANLTRFAPCTATDDPAACARAFADRTARKAWGRLPTSDELDRLGTVFKVGRDQEGYAAGIGLVAQAVLESPYFIYVSELGGAPDQGRVKLTDFEIAAQLSLLLRGSRPDQPLFDAAVAGGLSSPDARESQARRLIASPESRRHLADFIRSWLELTRPVNKDMAIVPILMPPLRAAMYRELAMFLDYVLSNSGRLDELMLADYTFANPALKQIYGADLLAAPGDFTKVPLDPRRRGILSSPMFLATHALINQTNPIERGLVVRTRLLCQDIPPPPPDVVAQTPTPGPGQTTRQKYEEHSKQPRCRACHQYMDPIGFGFEQFDLLGRYRTKEGEIPIDASGNLAGTDVDGPFTGPAQLAQRLMTSPTFRHCFVQQLWRFAESRAAGPEDDPEIDALAGAFERADHRIDELLIAIVRKPTFILRRVTP
jgi:hypothetical protein